MCIADFFEHGHTMDEIMNMDYHDYLFILNAINDKRGHDNGKGGSRSFRPVQRDAINNLKKMSEK